MWFEKFTKSGFDWLKNVFGRITGKKEKSEEPGAADEFSPWYSAVPKERHETPTDAEGELAGHRKLEVPEPGPTFEGHPAPVHSQIEEEAPTVQTAGETADYQEAPEREPFVDPLIRAKNASRDLNVPANIELVETEKGDFVGVEKVSKWTPASYPEAPKTSMASQEDARKAQTVSESSTFLHKTAKRETIEGGVYIDWGPDLPAAYGSDSIEIMPIDPFQLYVYWDKTGETTRALLEKHGSDLWAKGMWEMLLVNVDTGAIEQIPLAGFQSDGYYRCKPGTVYVAKLAFRFVSGETVIVAESQPVETPTNRLAKFDRRERIQEPERVQEIRRQVGQTFFETSEPPEELFGLPWDFEDAHIDEHQQLEDEPRGPESIGGGFPAGHPRREDHPDAIVPEELEMPTTIPPGATRGRWVFEPFHQTPSFVWYEYDESASEEETWSGWRSLGSDGEVFYEEWVTPVKGWYGGFEWEEIPEILWDSVIDFANSRIAVQSGVRRRRAPSSQVLSGRRSWPTSKFAVPLSGRREWPSSRMAAKKPSSPGNWQKEWVSSQGNPAPLSYKPDENSISSHYGELI
ncbi:MAG: DUF4912 domain-containing protein [Planctomycetes bacterium]|nr:DUF4912 domain-containing protein [Planctomycetota bacterium]